MFSIADLHRRRADLARQIAEINEMIRRFGAGQIWPYDPFRPVPLRSIRGSFRFRQPPPPRSRRP